MTNFYKDGERDHPALDPADLTFAQKRQLARLYVQGYGPTKHPLQDYVDMEEDHYNMCVTYGCGCDPTFILVDGKVVA